MILVLGAVRVGVCDPKVGSDTEVVGSHQGEQKLEAEHGMRMNESEGEADENAARRFLCSGRQFCASCTV